MDKFDAPSYSSDDLAFQDQSIAEKIRPITDVLKKNAKIIIALIVILVIGFLVYDFFIGSYRTVDFSLENTEGDSISATTFRIFDAGGTKLFETSGSKQFSTKLKAGEYRIEAKAGPDYESLNESLTVTGDSSETFTFEKKISAAITGFQDNFPRILVAGQEAEFQITVENSGSEIQEIEFVASKELSKIGLKISKITVGGKNSENATVAISVPAGIAIANTKDGDAVTGTIRIKYTNITEKVPLDAKVFPKPILAFSPLNLSIEGDAGQDVLKDFTITNNSTFPVSGIKLRLEITSISKNSESAILESIQFTEGTEIGSLGAKSSADKDFKNKIRFNIPIASKAETITGAIVAEGAMLPEPERWPITLKVRTEAQFGLTLTAAPSTASIMELSSGLFEVKNGTINVLNSGKLDLENIHLETKNRSECYSDWLKLEETIISSLAKGKSKKIPVTLSAPLVNTGATMRCWIRYWYDDPVNPGNTIEDEMNSSIDITPRAK